MQRITSNPSHSFLTTFILATLKKNSRSFFTFDAQVDWHERHKFLKCKAISYMAFYKLLTFELSRSPS